MLAHRAAVYIHTCTCVFYVNASSYFTVDWNYNIPNSHQSV